MSHIFWSCPVVVQKRYLKRPPVSCTNTHDGIIDYENQGMVKNAKTRQFWEQKTNFLRNKKLLNLSLFWHFWEHLFSRTLGSSQNSYMYFGGKTFLSRDKGVSLTLVGHPSKDGIAIKISYGVDILCFMLTRLTAHLFLEGWLKLNLNS